MDDDTNGRISSSRVCWYSNRRRVAHMADPRELPAAILTIHHNQLLRTIPARLETLMVDLNGPGSVTAGVRSYATPKESSPMLDPSAKFLMCLVA